jgi:hypothetical protein
MNLTAFCDIQVGSTDERVDASFYHYGRTPCVFGHDCFKEHDHTVIVVASRIVLHIFFWFPFECVSFSLSFEINPHCETASKIVRGISMVYIMFR